jgi:class 3 adenylate cyclase
MLVKKSLIKVICSIILSLAFGILLIWLFSGPKLDFVYDYVMSRRKTPQASSEIVLIDVAQEMRSANISDPAIIALALMTLSEMQAGPVVVQTSVMVISSSGGNNEEIITQVSDEFIRIEENIDNLFRGIKTGSISPTESETYVNELLDLIDRGKDRLVYSVSEQELAGLRFFENAVRIKHDVYLKDDSRSAHYREYLPDADGMLRRIAPIIYLEDTSESHYLMYDAIVDRLNPQRIQFTDLGMLFSRMQGRGFENNDFLFPADKNGALLLDGIGKDIDFRRFSIQDFFTYNELDAILFQKLEEMETLGYYDALVPEKHPTALYRYALAIKDDLLREPNAVTLENWIEAREDFFDGVNDFFLSGTETKLVSGYETLIASEDLEDEVKAELAIMRNILIQIFHECRKAHNNILTYRENLKSQLNNAFCIIGPLGTEQNSWGRGASVNPSETEAAAIFANMFFTENVITPVENIQILFWIFLWVFFLSFFVRNAHVIVTVVLGVVAAILSVIFFASLFVYWDLWIHPAIPAASLLFAAFVSVMLELIFKRRLALELRRAYSPYVSASALKKIIKRTGPEPWETLTAFSAIVAVRSSSVHTSESKDSPVISALAVRAFRDEVSELLKNANAVIIGGDGDLVLAAFASPLERSALWNAGIAHQYMNNENDKGKVNPADKAISAVTEIAKQKTDTSGWSFGIDCGECAFTYSDASGYSAFGHAVVKARLLSSLSHKYHAKILISEQVKAQTTLAVETRQLDTLVERELGTKESFFALKS